MILRKNSKLYVWTSKAFDRFVFDKFIDKFSINVILKYICICIFTNSLLWFNISYRSIIVSFSNIKFCQLSWITHFILFWYLLFCFASGKWNFTKIYNISKVVVKLSNSFINIFIFEIEFSLQWLWFLDSFNWISIFYKWSHLLTWKFSTSLASWACMYPGSTIYIPVVQQDGIYLTKVFESLMFYSLDSCTKYRHLLQMKSYS